MPRKRHIKPTIFANEELGAETTDPLMIPLFSAMWCLADREGRLEDRPNKIVKGFAFPYRSIPNPDSMIQWLADHGFIVRYNVRECNYIQILNFTQHQDIHPHEARSVIPAIPTDKGMSGNVITSNDIGPPTSTNGGECNSYTSYPSLPSSTSLPSLKNGTTEAVVVGQAAIERRIWEDGMDLMIQKGKMTEAQARPFLGRQAKQYTEALLAEAIAVTLAKNPVDPKAFLIGVLKQRSEPAWKQVGKNKPQTEEEVKAEIEAMYNCLECFDFGTITVPTEPGDPQIVGMPGLKFLPCPKGCEERKL